MYTGQSRKIEIEEIRNSQKFKQQMFCENVSFNIFIYCDFGKTVLNVFGNQNLGTFELKLFEDSQNTFVCYFIVSSRTSSE